MPDWWVDFWCDYGPYVVVFFLGVLTVLVIEIIHETLTAKIIDEDEQQIEIEEIDHN